MTSLDLNGTGVALITPFKGGAIDFKALTSVIENVIAGGVEYVVSLGTTGESTSLTDIEQKAIIRHTIEIVNKRVPIVAGHFGGNNTEVLREKLASFDAEGIAGILSSSPAYVKPTQEGIYRHYMVLAEASPLPIIIYNVPSRTASNVSASTIIRLANDSQNIIGVKDASADLFQAAATARNIPPHFFLLSGDDPTALPFLSNGGRGVISVIANVFPEAFSSMMRHALSGEWGHARNLHFKLLDLHHWLYIDGNPVGIKEAMAYRGICEPDVRLPLVGMSDANKRKLHEAMDQLTGLK
ncbi:MAG: 4-hydroxy-tetrahydrodipicolinate synthase [Bacteroidota bacterium]|nr:4-hydroxy-tetrahydrodipicolinate synthase [Bacteroidota bacterium]